MRGCLFDMDGVLTETATVHARAWKSMFDAYLRRREGEGFEPFTQDDYDRYVDGKPRYDGVRSFLQSRGIELPQGTPDDPPGAETVDGLGNRKNELVLQLIRDVRAYPGSVRYLDAARDAGLRRAVVSSSANCADVLRAAGNELGMQAAHAAVFEDALSGVEAGRAGNFGCVVGVDRVGQAEALSEHGASVVVKDLADLL